MNNNNNGKVVITVIITFFLTLLVICGGIYYFKDDIFGSNITSVENGTCYTKCENKVTINENGISDAVDKIFNSVVLVENYQKQKLYSSGTGFVYKTDDKYGYILTNYHVIEGNSSLKVVMADDKEVDGKYLGGDQYMDIAIIRIPKEYVLKIAALGTSENSKLGDTVFTVGSPIAYEYRGTVTRGILSGKDRMVTISNTDQVMRVLQTDAAINPGNSGGPLCNSNGEVIGINSLKLAQAEIEGMGFAIAIENIKSHLETFEKGEKIKRPFLGISMLNIHEEYALSKEGITIDKNITEGVAVVSVVKGSSVDGILKKGDVISKINGVKVKDAAYLKYELFKYSVGDKIDITYFRNNKEASTKITLKGNND